MSIELYKPIPQDAGDVTDWKILPIKECGEPLVPLGIFSKFPIFTHSIYFGEKIDSPYPSDFLEGSLITIFARLEVAQQLEQAQSLLPERMYLVAFDIYRKLEVQHSLYENYRKALQKQHPEYENLAATKPGYENLLEEKTQAMVSMPAGGPTAQPATLHVSTHNTGGSVDVAVFELPKKVDQRFRQINKHLSLLHNRDWELAYMLEMEKIDLIARYGQILNFGTPFDWGGEESAITYYEKLALKKELSDNELECLNSRRLLYNIMITVGFQAYEDEFWHYNSTKTQMGAKSAGLDHAEYGAIVLSLDNLEHERMRKMHWLGSIRLRKGELMTNKFGNLNFLHPAFKVAQTTASKVDIRASQFPLAAIIAPQQ